MRRIGVISITVLGAVSIFTLLYSALKEYAGLRLGMDDVRPWCLLSMPLLIFILSMLLPRKRPDNKLLVVSDGKKTIITLFADGAEVRFSRYGTRLLSTSEGKIRVRGGYCRGRPACLSWSWANT